MKIEFLFQDYKVARAIQKCGKGFEELIRYMICQEMAVGHFEPMEGKKRPPSVLGRSTEERFIGSKGEDQRNLKSLKVIVFICLGVGGMILARKRI